MEETRPVLRLVFGEPQLDSRLAVHGQEVRAETDAVVVVAGGRVGHRARLVVLVERRVARRNCGTPALDGVVPAAVERVAVDERGRLRRAVRNLRLLQHEVVEDRHLVLVRIDALRLDAIDARRGDAHVAHELLPESGFRRAGLVEFRASDAEPERVAVVAVGARDELGGEPVEPRLRHRHVLIDALVCSVTRILHIYCESAALRPSVRVQHPSRRVCRAREAGVGHAQHLPGCQRRTVLHGFCALAGSYARARIEVAVLDEVDAGAGVDGGGQNESARDDLHHAVHCFVPFAQGARPASCFLPVANIVTFFSLKVYHIAPRTTSGF